MVQSNNSNVQQISSLPEQLPTSEQLSRNSSLHNSFRSSPVATGTSYNPSVTPTNQNQKFFEGSFVSAQVASSSRPIPARVLEPATPQNTPANVSFPGFAPYVNRDLLSTSNFDKEVVLKNPNQLNSPPEFSKGSTLETTTEFPYKPTSGETEATSTPISAAKVTEKLEHLLAEQQENSSSITTSKVLSEVDEITSSVTTELAKSFESQSDVLKATNEIIDKSHEAKLNDVQGKAAQSGSDTWSDVFLGQEPAAQSVICPEIHTTDNNPIVTDLQATKSNAHPSQQHYQVQAISMPSSTFYIDKPAEQKSSLNYVSPVQLPQQNDFYSLPKSTEQSASVFFESTKPNRFPSSSLQERNTNSPFGQPLVNATNNPPLAPENSVFSSKTIDSAHVPFWNADQSSQSQVLNAISSQQVYTAPNQPVHTPIQQSAPVFYNPAQFANELPKQSTFPYTYDQRSPQQQSYQTPPFYGDSSGLHQPYAVPENNTTYPSPYVSMVMSVPEPTGSATLSPVQMSINSPTNRTTPDTVPPSFQNLVRIYHEMLFFDLFIKLGEYMYLIKFYN